MASSPDNSPVPTSNVFIYDVSPSAWPSPSASMPGGDFVAVTMSICAPDTFAAPGGWNRRKLMTMASNPLALWTQNECGPMQPCLSFTFFRDNACKQQSGKDHVITYMRPYAYRLAYYTHLGASSPPP